MRKRLLSTRLFTVEQREYPQAGRDPLVRDVIVHPGAVVILPILDDGRVVMIRNYRHAVERELWELPAGTLEPNEEPIETARRELEEETGYRAAVVAPMVEFFTSPGILSERMHAFTATGLTHVGQNLQGGEQITVETLERDELHRMLIEGELQDGKTIAVLGMYFAQDAK